jgi:predicted small lipoprotein YifL
MTSRSNPSFSKLTAIGLIVATCVLAGCGRKAGLDLPPGASAAQKNADGTPAASADGQNTAGNLSNEVYRAPGSSSIAVAPRGEKKRIPLDAILD